MRATYHLHHTIQTLLRLQRVVPDAVPLRRQGRPSAVVQPRRISYVGLRDAAARPSLRCSHHVLHPLLLTPLLLGVKRVPPRLVPLTVRRRLLRIVRDRRRRLALSPLELSPGLLELDVDFVSSPPLHRANSQDTLRDCVVCYMTEHGCEP